MNQRVGVERAEVFSWTDCVVSSTQVRANSVSVFNSANSEWERAPCGQVNKPNKVK